MLDGRADGCGECRAGRTPSGWRPAKRDGAAMARRPRAAPVDGTGPPCPAPAVFARRPGYQCPELHAPACGIHPGTPRRALLGSGRPHSPTLSRASVPTAGLFARAKRNGWDSRSSLERRRSFGVDLPRSPRFSTKSQQKRRRPPCATPAGRGIDSYLHQPPGRAFFTLEIVIGTENTVFTKAFARLRFGFPACETNLTSTCS